MAAGRCAPDAGATMSMDQDSPVKTRTSRRKGLVFLLVITLFYVLVGEVVARTLFAVLSGSMMPLVYGIDRDVRFVDLSPLRNPVFYRECDDCLSEGATREQAAAAQGARPLAYALGGSTTFGANCSSAASSWPAELDALLPEFEVVNLGRNGTNSDYAVAALEAVLTERRPALVLWANWINELDIVFEGPRRNRERLAGRFGDLFETREADFAAHGVRYFLASLDRSFYEVSALYLLVSKALSQAGIVRRVKSSEWGGLGEAERELSIANAMLNLADAHALSRSHGFTLVLVRLPMSWPAFGRTVAPETLAFVRRWNEALMVRVRAFAEDRDLAVLDVQDALAGREDEAALFCDSVHMRRAGHQALARVLAPMVRARGPS